MVGKPQSNNPRVEFLMRVLVRVHVCLSSMHCPNVLEALRYFELAIMVKVIFHLAIIFGDKRARTVWPFDFFFFTLRYVLL